jgi:3-oxoacyl-[acyl-carrier-protein] synthase III
LRVPMAMQYRRPEHSLGHMFSRLLPQAASGTRPAAGITHLAYCLPVRRITVDELAAGGLIRSRPEQLRHLGFRNLYIAGEETAYDLACGAVRKVLRSSQTDPVEIDTLIYASALPEERPRRGRNPASLFHYPATALQYEFGLTHATVLGLAQAGCVSFLSAIRVASSLLASEPAVRRVLASAPTCFPGARAAKSCTT